MAEKKEQWIELGRVIPWSDADYASHKLLPETFRDENGDPIKMEPPTLEPHIILQNIADPEKPTKVVKIPKREYDAIRKMLETGEMLPEDLSHLPLRDLCPSLVEHLSDEGRRRSGAKRGPNFDAGGAPAHGSGVAQEPTDPTGEED